MADISRPLPFADGAFDDVVVSLVLHYLQDWTAPLAELRRVLKPGGRLLLSVNHPRILESSDPSADYFSVTQYSDEYTFDGQRAVLTYWHRPLHAMSDAFTRAGFRISVISEPPFAPDTPTRAPPARARRPHGVPLLHLLRPPRTLSSQLETSAHANVRRRSRSRLWLAEGFTSASYRRVSGCVTPPPVTPSISLSRKPMVVRDALLARFCSRHSSRQLVPVTQPPCLEDRSRSESSQQRWTENRGQDAAKWSFARLSRTGRQLT